MCEVTFQVAGRRQRPQPRRTASKRRPGSTAAAGPDVAAWPVARKGNRTGNRTASDVYRTRTGGSGSRRRRPTGWAAASDTNAATAEARPPGRRCACAGVGAARRKCRTACRNTTAGRRPSTNTRTAIGWRPRPERPAGRERTPRPSCGAGAAVGVGGERPTVGDGGERPRRRRLRRPPSSGWRRIACNRPGTWPPAAAAVCRRPSERPAGNPRSTGRGTAVAVPPRPIWSRGSWVASRPTPPCGDGDVGAPTVAGGGAPTGNLRLPSERPPRRPTTNVCCAIVRRVFYRPRPRPLPATCGSKRSLCCCTCHRRHRWPRASLSLWSRPGWSTWRWQWWRRRRRRLQLRPLRRPAAERTIRKVWNSNGPWWWRGWSWLAAGDCGRPTCGRAANRCSNTTTTMTTTATANACLGHRHRHLHRRHLRGRKTTTTTKTATTTSSCDGYRSCRSSSCRSAAPVRQIRSDCKSALTAPVDCSWRPTVIRKKIIRYWKSKWKDLFSTVISGQYNS